MRLWSLHPRHLDRQGLVACWREALLAQAVLAGRTTGYRNHPPLHRFRNLPDPGFAVGHYLAGLAREATARGYRFDSAHIDHAQAPAPAIPVTTGQLEFERDHLLGKLRRRNPDQADLLATADPHEAHPAFEVITGAIESWERP